jgi:NAD(P)-dependent dehydrogenase (short-subunit alcohol dehydrogenase family)
MTSAAPAPPRFSRPRNPDSCDPGAVPAGRIHVLAHPLRRLHPVFVVQVDVGQIDVPRRLEGAATRTCAHQIGCGHTKVEAKVPRHPANALKQVIRLIRCAAPGTPRDIAEVVAPLASLDARWLTGQITKPAGSLT